MTARERFERSFINRKRAFIIAIHVTPDKEAWAADIEVARDEGADGIIVIRDYRTLVTDEDVLVAYDYARDRYPRWWIGVNLLQHTPQDAVFRIKHTTSGIWFDNVRIDEGMPFGNAYLSMVRAKSDALHPPTPPLFLPSIAMKYQEPVKNLAGVAKLAEPFADVIITSGDATGVPADFEKVKTLRAATDSPIGLASGISSDNVAQFIELGVDVFIVNTSITDPDTNLLDWEKVNILRRKIPRK